MEKTPPDMKVRLSAELRRKITEAAHENNRTLNSEIVFRLEASFREGGGLALAGSDQANELANVRERVEMLEGRLDAIPVDQLEAFRDLMQALKRGEVVTLADAQRE